MEGTRGEVSWRPLILDCEQTARVSRLVSGSKGCISWFRRSSWEGTLTPPASWKLEGPVGVSLSPISSTAMWSGVNRRISS